MKLSTPQAMILLLCSDHAVRSVVQEILEGASYVVRPANDLGGAVSRLEESTPDLLIVFVYIDSLTGAEAARYLRTKCHGLPVLLLSGFPEDERLRMRDDVRCFKLFPDPFPAAALLAKVKEVLSQEKSQTAQR